MKIISLITFVIAITSSLSGLAANSQENFRTREFNLLCKSSLDLLSFKPSLVISDRVIDLEAMKSKLQDISIEWANQELELNGKKVDAINFPNKKSILINLTTWDSLDKFSKTQLCLHEMWGVTFNDQQDDRYKFTSQIVNVLRLSSLKESFLVFQCKPRNNKLEKISITISTEFLMFFASDVIDEKDVSFVSGFAQWIGEKNKISTRSSAFLTVDDTGFLVERFESQRNRVYDRLFLPIDKIFDSPISSEAKLETSNGSHTYDCSVSL